MSAAVRSKSPASARGETPAEFYEQALLGQRVAQVLSFPKLVKCEEDRYQAPTKELLASLGNLPVTALNDGYTTRQWRELHRPLAYSSDMRAQRAVDLTIDYANGEMQRIGRDPDAPVRYVEPEAHIVLAEG